MILSDKAQFAVDFLDLPKAAEIEDAVWEDFQIDFLNETSRGRSDNKARQIAWSFTAALDAVVDGHDFFNPGTPHVFVSMNQEESAEKIRYVKSIIEALDPAVRPRIIKDSTTGIEIANRTRFISHPQRAVRGKPRTRVYLDEKAHYREGLDREIYKGSTPAMTKGDGYIRIGSSPFGARGMFWEIHTESMRAYPGFVRSDIPWWVVRALCNDITHAKGDPLKMTTEQRVYTYGTESLIWQFENNFIEDFKQEYECEFVDESTAWISWKTIQDNQDDSLLYWHAKSIDEAIAMIPEIVLAHRESKIERVLAGGLDVGRTRDLTELVLLGKSESGSMPIRFMVSLYNVMLDDQQACFEKIFKTIPITNVLIDQNGLGRQLAEGLQRTGRATGVDFTNETKEYWAIGARLAAERLKTPIPSLRDLAYQIHSIRKTATPTMKNKYDTERNEKHHADKFWAWALAIDACNQGGITYNQLEQLGKVEGHGDRWKAP